MVKRVNTLDLPYPETLNVDGRPEMELYLTGSRDDAQAIHELIAPNWDYLEEFNQLSETNPSVEAVEAATEKTVRGMFARTELQYLVTAHAVLVGRVGLTDMDRDPGVARVSYWLGRQYQSNRYACAAARRIIKFGFDELALEEVHIGVHRDNVKSERVAHRLGAQLTGIVDIETHKGRSIAYRRWEIVK